MKTVDIHEWIDCGQKLIDQAATIFENAPSNDVRELSNRLPTRMVVANEVLQVVFAGQYGAGKSLILKVMTGKEGIAVGPGIVTQRTQRLDWNGISVVDTPGIHTELRPDHDAITYEAISSADLLVFVITNELFDSHLAEHFRKLAIERGKAHEMMLVVNKMRRHAKGNTQTARDVITEDIGKVLAPYTPKQLRTSFIDAKAAFDAQCEEDQEVGSLLHRKSGFDDFLDSFNAFIREEGIASRYTTALYTLEQVLQEALAVESSGDKDIDGLEELLVQQRRALADTRAQIPKSVESKVQSTTSKIKQEGRKVADLIHGSADSKDVDRELQAAQQRVEQYTIELTDLVQDTVETHMSDLAKRVNQITESELAKELLPRLVARMEIELQGVDIDTDTIRKAKKAADASGKLGQFLLNNSFNPKAKTFFGLFKLNQYSGTATHKAVKAVGNFFGKSFKPWGAVKWTRTIANAGRVFAVVGSVLTIALQWKEDVDAAKLEVDLRESRSAVRAGFGEAAHSIEMHFDKVTGNYVDETIAKRMADVDKQLSELREMQTSQGSMFQDLVGLLEDTRALITEMHESETKGDPEDFGCT